MTNIAGRIGESRRPWRETLKCMTNQGCPAICRLDNGDFAIIGRKAPSRIREQLKYHSASIGPGEEFVTVEKQLFLNAVGDLSARDLVMAKVRRLGESLFVNISLWVVAAVVRFRAVAQRWAAPIAAPYRFA